jgi:two-component system, chemotaxis family, chemotaxis protein CheY
MKRIMIVDDSKTMRDIIKFTLSEEFKESEILLCDNGEEALKELEKIKYDLVITDLNMPIMGGDILIKKIREKKLFVPVIIMTTEKPNSSINHIAWIIKPFKPENLINIIKKILP